MRSRSLLHYSKLAEFEAFARSKGFTVEKPKGDYEFLRFKKDKELIIGHKRDRTAHITLTGKGIIMFYEFQEAQKQQGKIK